MSQNSQAFNVLIATVPMTYPFAAGNVHLEEDGTISCTESGIPFTVFHHLNIHCKRRPLHLGRKATVSREPRYVILFPLTCFHTDSPKTFFWLHEHFCPEVTFSLIAIYYYSVLVSYFSMRWATILLGRGVVEGAYSGEGDQRDQHEGCLHRGACVLVRRQKTKD